MPKLADKYVSRNYRVPDNSVYGTYQRVIDHAFRDTPEPNIVFPGGDVSGIALDYSERAFYDNLYVHSTDPAPARTLAEAELNTQIGDIESDFFNFSDMTSRIAVLPAHIGWGKTTLLRYVFFHLVKLCPSKRESHWVIYLPVDRDSNRIKHNNTELPAKSVDLVNEVVCSHLRHYLGPIISVENEDLWTFYKMFAIFFSSTYR